MSAQERPAEPPPRRMIDRRGILKVEHYGEAADVTLLTDDGDEIDVLETLEELDGARVVMLVGRVL